MVESQHVDEDAVMYGDDPADGHVFLHDADMLDQPDLFYGAQGKQQLKISTRGLLCTSRCRERKLAKKLHCVSKNFAPFFFTL